MRACRRCLAEGARNGRGSSSGIASRCSRRPVLSPRSYRLPATVAASAVRLLPMLAIGNETVTRARRNGPRGWLRRSQLLGRLGAVERLELLDRIDARAAARAQVVGLARHAHEGAAALLAGQHLGHLARVERRLDQVGRLQRRRCGRSRRVHSVRQVGERAHRILAVPVGRGLADQLEQLALGAGHLGQLDRRARQARAVLEVDEAAVLAHLAAHADDEAGLLGALQVGVEAARSSRPRAAPRGVRPAGSRGTSTARRCASAAARSAATRRWRVPPSCAARGARHGSGSCGSARAGCSTTGPTPITDDQ